MGWTRKTRRATLRLRRSVIETLESRALLTARPGPAGTRLGPAMVASLNSHPSPVDSSLNSSARSTGDLIAAAQTRSAYGVDGTGMTVAVIDTGIDYQINALGNGFGAGHKVVAGYDFSEGDGDPLSTNLHGTAVAGLIASNDPSHPGVAPGANLAALRVFNNADQGSFGNVALALQWVIDHHDQYHITAVNLSLSDGNNYPQNWFDNDNGVGQQITDLISQLDALKIPVVAATGNSLVGKQEGVGFPAIVPDTISVTSTDATGDQLSSTAQRISSTVSDSATDIAAPGEGLVAPVSGNQFGTVDGTSFATSQVTGAVVLLQQIYQSRFGHLPTVAQLDTWLQEGSDPVSDPITHLSIGRLDVLKAAGSIPNPQPQVLTNPTADAQTISNAVAGSIATTTTTTNPNSATTGAGTTTIVGTDTSQQGQQQASASAQNATVTSNVGMRSAPVVGVSTETADHEKLADPLGGLSSQIPVALRSLSDWAGGPAGNGSGGRVRIWTNANVRKDLGTSHPTGQIKSIVHELHPAGFLAVRGRHLPHSPFVRRGRRR